MKASPVTYEEMQLMAIYNTGTRNGLLQALIDMQAYLSKEEQELNNLTASAISKLQEMSDDEYEALDLVPDFDPDDEQI
jgi:cell division protein FtsB